MRVDVIDNFQDFNSLRNNWDAVYEADPEARFFLSWMWLSQWLPALRTHWLILAVKPKADASDYIAFFPLRIGTKLRKGVGFYNEIHMAGNYSADYTGFICTPDAQHFAIPALARYLKKLNWACIHLEYISASEERRRLFFDHFSPKKFNIVEGQRINKGDINNGDINNCLCPSVILPGDWDAYLNNNLSSNTRQKVRRFLRTIENDSTFRITHTQADTVERDLKILLEFWRSKWGARKGKRLGSIMKSNYRMLLRSFQNGSLFLPVLWREETPLCALASLIDRQKKSLLFYIGGRDESFNNPPPGTVLHAHSIQYAISQGITTYDFLRGNEQYKYSFGGQDHRIHCFQLSTKTGRNLGEKLDRRTLRDVLQHATKAHQAGDLDAAERGYRQVLDVDSTNQGALYCLGQLMVTKGNHNAAVRHFRSLVAVKPDLSKAWFRLGNSLKALGLFAEAADAYREVIKRQPGSTAAHYGLGNTLMKLGKVDAAIAAFAALRSLRPDDTKIEAYLADALGKAKNPPLKGEIVTRH